MATHQELADEMGFARGQEQARERIEELEGLCFQVSRRLKAVNLHLQYAEIDALIGYLDQAKYLG
jgi:hypothetical protein